MLSTHLVIARVAKPQGVHGEIKLIPITADVSRFEGLKKIWRRQNDAFVPCNIRVTRVEENAVYAFFDGITDRNEAEKLRDELIYIDRAHAVKPGPDSDFICDLIGLNAFDSDGRELGTLTDVLQPGGNDVYVLTRGRLEILVPALKSVVERIDYDEGVIVFNAARLKEVSVTNED